MDLCTFNKAVLPFSSQRFKNKAIFPRHFRRLFGNCFHNLPQSLFYFFLNCNANKRLTALHTSNPQPGGPPSSRRGEAPCSHLCFVSFPFLLFFSPETSLSRGDFTKPAFSRVILAGTGMEQLNASLAGGPGRLWVSPLPSTSPPLGPCKCQMAPSRLVCLCFNRSEVNFQGECYECCSEHGFPWLLPVGKKSEQGNGCLGCSSVL